MSDSDALTVPSTAPGAVPEAAPSGSASLLLRAAVGPLLCAAAYALGAAKGPVPILAMLALAALLFGALRAPGRIALTSFVLAGVLYLAVAAGLLPGFGRLPLGPSASINAAKALAGLAALAMFPSFWAWNRRCTVIGAACLALLPALAFAIGFVHWAPSALGALLLFAVANLFTVIGEEWFFRHWIQRPLQRWGQPLALVVSAVLFGLVHLGGGAAFAGLATLAGLAYGGVYAASGGSIRAAVALHLALNVLRTALFGT